MSKTIQTDTYEGIGPEAAGQGQATVDSNIGTLAGGAAAAGATALGLKFANEKTIHLISKTPVFGGMVKGGTGAMILATVAAATLVGSVTAITGYFRGKAKAENGRLQFEALKAERDLATGQMNAVQQALANGPRGAYTASASTDRATHSEQAR